MDDLQPTACLLLQHDLLPHRVGTRFDLVKSPTLIGRVEGADIVIPADVVSRRQCRFELRDGAWWVSDGGSTGGTFVNHASVGYQGEHSLVEGDLLTFGQIRIMFLAGDEGVA